MEAVEWVVPAEGVTKSHSSCGNNDCGLISKFNIVLLSDFVEHLVFFEKEFDLACKLVVNHASRE